MPVRRIFKVLRAKYQSLSRASFVRSVGILVGGTAFAQAIAILVLPFVTRLYTPADFSVLAVYVAVLSIVAVMACLRLELALAIPERDEDAINLLALALCSSFVIAGVMGLVVLIFPTHLVRWVNQPALKPYLWMLPVGVWISSSYSAMQFWSIRKKKFGVIAATRMTQAVGGAGVQVGLGWAGSAPWGLLLGHMISTGAGLFGLGRRLRDDRHLLAGISWSGMRSVFKQYDRFPKYSTWEAVANSANLQLPIIIISAFVFSSEAGMMMLAMRVMQAPMTLIGAAVSQVYLANAVEQLRADQLRKYTLEVMGKLIKIGVGPILFIGIIAPSIFPIIFGQQWQRAGEIAGWLTPSFLIQFVAIPVSMILNITKNQTTALSLQLFGLFFKVGALLIASIATPQKAIEVFSVASGLFQVFYLLVVVSFASVSPGAAAMLFLKYWKVILFWAVLGVAASQALSFL